MVELNLNENNINRWTNIQLRNIVFLKKIINDKPLPKTKKKLLNLWVEWREKIETD